MHTRTSFLAAAVLATAGAFASFVPALADLAPRPDSYTGPASATVAGFTFEHKRIRHIGPASAPENQRHPLAYGTYVFLTACDSGSDACASATQNGAIGGAVVKVDGVDIGDNVQTVEDALANSGDHTLTVVAGPDVIVQPDQPREIEIAVSVP